MVWAVKKSSSYVQVLFATAWCSAYAVAAAGLQEPSLRAGSASFQLQDPSNAVIHQTSSKDIIDWRAFSLAPADRLKPQQGLTAELLATHARQTRKTLDDHGDRRLLFNLSVSF